MWMSQRRTSQRLILIRIQMMIQMMIQMSLKISPLSRIFLLLFTARLTYCFQQSDGLIPLGESGHLFTTEMLQSYNLAVNTEYLFYVCTICHSGMATAQQVMRHLNQSHRISRKKALRTRLLLLAKQLGLQGLIPDMSHEKHPYLHGIHQEEAYGCQYCPCAMAWTKNLRDHVRAEHSEVKDYKEPKTKVLAQRLLARRNAPLYQVNAPLGEDADDAQPDDLPDFINSFDWKQHRTGSTRSARKISPWLLRTKFHTHVDGFDHTTLRKLVAHPDNRKRRDNDDNEDPPELKNLQDAVYTFFDQCTDLLEEIDELVLCRLLTTNEELK